MLVVVLVGILELAEQDRQTALVLRGLEGAVAEEVQEAQGIQEVAAGGLGFLAKVAMETVPPPTPLGAAEVLAANKGRRLVAAQALQAGVILAAVAAQIQVRP